MSIRISPCFAVTAIALLQLILASLTHAAAKRQTVILDATDGTALVVNVGKKVSVKGTVVSAVKDPNDRLRVLNFSHNPARGFAAAIVPALYPQLEPLDVYVGRRVKVTGRVEQHQTQTFIRVTKISQLTLIKTPEEKALAEKDRAARTAN